MSSPFSKGGTATKAAPAKAPAKAAGKADSSDVPDVTNVGDSKPVGADPFAASDPVGISGTVVTSFLDQLILIRPIEVGTMNTTVGPNQEYVSADVIALTAPEEADYEPGERFDGVMVWQIALRRELKKRLDDGGGWLIGRIVLGNKKPGQNAPYILAPADDDDKALYQEWKAANAK